MTLALVEPYSAKDKAVRKLAARLALKGATVIGAYAPDVQALWVPWCDAPVTVSAGVRPGRGRRAVRVAMRVPCRKCERCITFRRLRWRQRMVNEMLLTDDAGKRSWYVTLTFAPVHLAGVLLEAQAFLKKGKTRDEAIEMAAYVHVQKWLKRVRKVSSATFRYVAVPEYGEDNGRLHYHLIVHEMDKPVLYTWLKTQWKSRVFEARLVECDNTRRLGGLASYLAKYLTKSAGRPRASVRYGAISRSPPANAAKGQSRRDRAP